METNKSKDMNFIKAMIRDYKINKGLIPLKTVTLDTGIVLQHFVIVFPLKHSIQ